MKLWVCIPVFNRIDFTLKCLESLSRQDYSDYKVIVCDDGSTDGTSQVLAKRYAWVTVLHGDGNLWWTAATNRCIDYVLANSNDPSDCIVTLNNDLEVPENYLSSLASAVAKYPKSLITSVGYDIKTGNMVSPGYRQNWFTSKVKAINPTTDHLPNDRSVAAVTHAAGRGTLIPLEVFQKIGMFDERHLPHYGADYDFSFRAARAGYAILVNYPSQVFSHVAETGLTEMRKSFSLREFYGYLSSIKSPANLRARWWLAVKNCPKMLLPFNLILDFIFVTGSYFKYHWRGYLGK